MKLTRGRGARPDFHAGQMSGTSRACCILRKPFIPHTMSIVASTMPVHARNHAHSASLQIERGHCPHQQIANEVKPHLAPTVIRATDRRHPIPQHPGRCGACSQVFYTFKVACVATSMLLLPEAARARRRAHRTPAARTAREASYRHAICTRSQQHMLSCTGHIALDVSCHA